jgi:hypothetical protein
MNCGAFGFRFLLFVVLCVLLLVFLELLLLEGDASCELVTMNSPEAYFP